MAPRQRRQPIAPPQQAKPTAFDDEQTQIVEPVSAPADFSFESYEGTTYVESENSELVTKSISEELDESFDELVGDGPTFALYSSLLRRKIVLDPNKTFVIGRAPEADLTLPVKKVSRRHAEIRFDLRGFSIHDLNSTNGTYVNGERIHMRRRLKAGARIDIGSFSIEVVELASVDEDIDMSVEDDSSETVLDVSADLTGMLEEISIAEVVQFIENTGRTGQLTFYQKHETGNVWIDHGTVIHAEFGLDSGESAALKLFGMRKGRFEFRRADITCPRTVNKSTTGLLMEAARLADESAIS